jgi:hypothetical protein
MRRLETTNHTRPVIAITGNRIQPTQLCFCLLNGRQDIGDTGSGDRDLIGHQLTSLTPA